MFKCEFCDREFIALNSKMYHQNRCKNNPNKIETIVSKKICPICNKLIGGTGYTKHVNYCRQYFVNSTDLAESFIDRPCSFCGKVCKNKNSFKQHEIRCPKNPDRISNGGSGWNKGLTKDTNTSLLQASEALKKSWADGKYDEVLWEHNSHPHSEATKEQLSKVAVSRRLGGWSNTKQCEYNNIYFDSKWEVKLAKELDKNNIMWERGKILYYLDCNQVMRRYMPDFYLPEFDVYLEPKNTYIYDRINVNGFTDRDKIYWVTVQNNVKIILLFGEKELHWEHILQSINKGLVS